MVILLFNHRKSHTSLRMAPESMTFNGVMAVILRYSTEFDIFGANCVKVVEDKPILSEKKCSAKNLVFSHV